MERIGERAKRIARRSVRRLVTRNLIHGAAAVVRRTALGDASRDGIKVVRDVNYGDAAVSEHKLDVFVPPTEGGDLPILLYVHGGGFSLCSKETHWGMALRFARRGYLVFNINYRLAPKNPFPAAIEDACLAYLWVLEHAREYGGDPTNIVLAGESAGANLVTGLSLATTMEFEDAFARRVFDTAVVPRAVIAACGILQVTDVERLWREREFPVWLRAALVDIETGYLPSPPPPASLADPLVALETRAPARQLPRFQAFVGTRDPLLDDTRRLQVAIEAHGGECVTDFYPGEVHAFHAMLFRPQARVAWRRTFEFLGH